MTTQPLISCILPTANRRAFLPRAIMYFLRQDYANRELLIVDDGDDSVADLVPADPRVRYMRLSGRRTLGAKRNLCVEAARGDLLMHWDDDDWYAPHRMSYQAGALLEAGAEVCSVTQMLFYELATGVVWLYNYTTRPVSWLAGGALLYTRDFWRRSPFPDIQVGSDTRFVWSQRLEHAVALPNYEFYVAMIHPGNTSPKPRRGALWSHWPGDIGAIMGTDLSFYQSIFELAGARLKSSAGVGIVGAPDLHSVLAKGVSSNMTAQVPTYSIIMVVHNAREMVQMATMRTLYHSSAHDARLIIVDNASNDGAGQWLDLLAQRGDIDLIRSDANIGHGPALELARLHTCSPYIVVLDSDAFPLSDAWLPRLRDRLNGQVKVSGIRHHRDYIHPACLMIERATLEEFGLTFLNEKELPSQLDVAERISVDLKRRGFKIAGLERTSAQRRGSLSEPVYLGSEYEGLVYHQWYTTRAVISGGQQVDDVPTEAIDRSLQEVFVHYHNQKRDITVVVGVRSLASEPQRQRNAIACLKALNLQDIPRWRYRIIVIEQDREPQLEGILAPLADRYQFAYNPGPYNRGWAFNIGACLAGASDILCLIDADLLIQPDFLRRGFAAFQTGQHVILPYNEVIYLDAASTERAIHDRLADPKAALRSEEYHGRVFTTSQGGCIWVETKLYHQIGGHNERFRGWGREDREFWERLERATPIARLTGRMLHLDHPRPLMEDTWALANQRLYEQVVAATFPKPVRPIGDLSLYEADRVIAASTLAQPMLGKRDWENWHRWNNARLERIVQNEERQARTTSSRYQLAEILVRLGDSLLDIGCGPGALWPHLEPYRPRFSWAGVDVTKEMVDTAHRLFPLVPVYHADAGCLPFDDNSFDVVLMRHVLEHLPSWLMQRALEEAMRVARWAIVVDFYIPPITNNVTKTDRVGEGFLETCWNASEVEAPIVGGGWAVRQRCTIATTYGEADVLWILAPQEASAEHRESLPAEPLKISIIMPTYHRHHTIYRTIETIQAQTYRNWELIIVDNAGDGDYHFDDLRIRLFRHTAQSSASYARNQGLQYATGDLVCFFDDDDDMFPHYLERFVAAFQDNPNAKMVRCGMIVSDGSVNYSYATPECCLRRSLATPTWSNSGPAHDQTYFSSIVAAHEWSEDGCDIVVVREALCRANWDRHGGLRSGNH